MREDFCPVRNDDDLVLREVGEELLVLNEKQEQLHQLNPTAAYIWDRCDGHHSVRAMAEEISEFYAIDYAQALDDITQVLTDFAACKLIDNTPSA